MYIILQKYKYEIDWTIEDTLEEVKYYLSNLPKENLIRVKVFELGKEIKIELNEVPFKGLKSE